MRNLITISIVAFTVAGCASSPERIAPAAVDETPYLNWSCQHLSEESHRLNVALATASAKQRETSNNDALGVFFLALPLGSMSGGDIAPEVAQLKGQVEAVHKASIKEHCNGTLPPAIATTGPSNPPAAATPVLAPSTGPGDVPFIIDVDGQSYEGVGKLENGHLAGQIKSGNKAIAFSGDIRGNELSVEVRGVFYRRSSYDAPGNSECVATGSARAAGKIALPMLATCGNGNVPTHVTLILDLPVAGAG